MDIKSMRKTVSISLSYEELELMEKLKTESVGNSEVFRRGLVSFCDEYKINMNPIDTNK